MTPVGTSDVAIVGDGPAGSALAQELTTRGVDVVLVGADRPWVATYTTWCDDLDGVALVNDGDIWMHRFETVGANFGQAQTIRRPYGVIDNARLRTVLRTGVQHRVESVSSPTQARGRIVIDATGWPSGLDHEDRRALDADPDSIAWQTAFGVVLDEPPSGPLGEPTVMDFSEPADAGDVDLPTFAYAFPVADGWLIEETVLAGRSIDPDGLITRLASRLDQTSEQLLARATRTERVRIPMGVPVPRHPERGGAVRFGAAAGMIHTASGYSVASSLRSAARVADAIVGCLVDDGPVERDALAVVADAVWPASLRRTRRLHDYGLDVLLSMNLDEIRDFFDTFFELPPDRWAAYLRIDTPPRELAGVMTRMFARADWRLRRQLVSADPWTLLSVLLPSS